MIVVDASAMIELLLQTHLGSRVEARLFRDGDDFHAPHLLDVEVVQALRRLVRTGDVPIARAEDAMEDLTLLDILRHPHVDLLDRVWQLRDTITAYDGVYVALAEAFDASLVTCHGPLGAAPGHAARIEVIR
ncbi:MAG TPA: type II toxin-antitoxin system VapC family toxin [Candidatus Binatia bacterium]|nr:type II toxin-antitoxin system VapC family toxin [Candidatus Binatia bacterium]